MKKLLFIIILFSPYLSNGQSKRPVQKFLIGINFSPDYSFRTLKNGDGASPTGMVANNRNDLEVAKTGYTTGINACFNLSQHLALETGLQFSNKGYKTKRTDLTFPDPSLPTKAKAYYRYHYIGIPVKAKFSFGQGKTRFVPGIGFMTNFLIAATTTTTYEFSNGTSQEMSQSSTSGFNKIDLCPVISLGIDYQLTKKTHLLAEPTFRYSLTKTKDAPVTEHLWNAGVNIGFFYALK